MKEVGMLVKKLKIAGAVALAAVVAVSGPLYNLLCTSHMGLDFLRRVSDAHYENASAAPINPDASPEVKALMRLFKENYGKKVFSGQYIDTYQDYTDKKFLDENGEMTILKTNEMTALTAANGGLLPAVAGFDFTGIESGTSLPNNLPDNMVALATEWHKKGGIVTFCWHWLVPTDVNADPNRTSGQVTMYQKDTNFNLADILADKDSALYKMLLSDIDKVSEKLAVLRDAGVPVLWRPLHEASGGWFWWGSQGPDAYKELYNIMYKIMTEEKGLNNLIWVYNGQKDDWYVGDDRADIIGDDPYAIDNKKPLYALDKARANRFKYQLKTSDKKMIAMSENAPVPAIDSMFDKNAKWLFFCTWMREMTVQKEAGTEYGMTDKYNEEYTSAEELKRIYADERVLTLDDLKELR